MINAVSASRNNFPSHLSDGEEVYGILGPVSQVGPDMVSALIGSRAVLLPASLELPEGHIFVLRLGNEHYVRRA
jgi:hypothetical protein